MAESLKQADGSPLKNAQGIADSQSVFISSSRLIFQAMQTQEVVEAWEWLLQETPLPSSGPLAHHANILCPRGEMRWKACLPACAAGRGRALPGSLDIGGDNLSTI